MKSSSLLLLVLFAVSFCEITDWDDVGDRIPDDLIVEVAAGETPIMVVFYKDPTHRTRLVDKINDSQELSDQDFTLATVDMNKDNYYDLARDVRIASAPDSDFPIIGVFKNGKGFVVKQYQNDDTIDVVIKKFETLV